MQAAASATMEPAARTRQANKTRRAGHRGHSHRLGQRWEGLQAGKLSQFCDAHYTVCRCRIIARDVARGTDAGHINGLPDEIRDSDSPPQCASVADEWRTGDDIGSADFVYQPASTSRCGSTTGDSRMDVAGSRWPGRSSRPATPCRQSRRWALSAMVEPSATPIVSQAGALIRGKRLLLVEVTFARQLAGGIRRFPGKVFG